MAVTITAPQSKVVGRGAVTLSWSPGYPQSSYEIQYREAGETAWSTFGQVSGSVPSVTMDLSMFEDFKLYHYRVVCYASNATSGTSTYNGSDFSAAYALMVVLANQVATIWRYSYRYYYMRAFYQWYYPWVYGYYRSYFSGYYTQYNYYRYSYSGSTIYYRYYYTTVRRYAYRYSTAYRYVYRYLYATQTLYQ